MEAALSDGSLRPTIEAFVRHLTPFRRDEIAAAESEEASALLHAKIGAFGHP